MVEWRTPMRSARSRFDDQEYMARTQPSNAEYLAFLMKTFNFVMTLAIAGVAGWSAVYGIAYVVRAAYKAVVR